MSDHSHLHFKECCQLEKKKLSKYLTRFYEKKTKILFVGKGIFFVHSDSTVCATWKHKPYRLFSQATVFQYFKVKFLLVSVPRWSGDYWQWMITIPHFLKGGTPFQLLFILICSSRIIVNIFAAMKQAVVCSLMYIHIHS